MKRFSVAVSVLASLALVSGISVADEGYQKFRLTFNVSNQSTASGVRTNADNSSQYEQRDPTGRVIGIETIDDPRPDQAVENELSIKDAIRYDLGISYGLVKWKWGELAIDASAGYFKGDLGDLEVAGEFVLSTGGGVDPPRVACGEITRFHLFFVPVGQVEQLPVKLGATFRFRTRAQGGPIRAMSPYVGAGVGYIFNKIDPTSEFMTLSKNVANSTGYYQYATGNGQASGSTQHRFSPAEAVAPDTFEYHVNAGLDFPLGKGWSVFLNGSYMWANDAIEVTVDGRENFGTATPNGETKIKYPERGLPVVFLIGRPVRLRQWDPDADRGAAVQVQGRPRGRPDRRRELLHPGRNGPVRRHLGRIWSSLPILVAMGRNLVLV